jgi:hypothetical protein
MSRNASVSSKKQEPAATSPRYRERAIVAKILQLPPRRQEELNGVIDDMLSQEQSRLSPEKRKELEADAARLLEDQEYEHLVRAAQVLSSPVLARAWDNPKDAKYNDL